MWRDVSVTDFVRNFADLINRVAYRGEYLRLRRGNRVLAEVHPAAAGAHLADLPDLLKNLPRLNAAEAESFGRDIAEARREIEHLAPEDRWES